MDAAHFLRKGHWPKNRAPSISPIEVGADRKALATILITEYGLLGILSGMIGAGFAAALSWAVSRFILNIEWEFDGMLTVAGAAITALVVLTVGVVSNFDVLLKKPLGILRSQ